MIIVSGATGTVGRHLLEELRAAATPARVLVRDPRSIAAVEAQGFAAVVGTFDDPDTLREGFVGAERLFLLSPPGTNAMVRQQLSAIDAARDAGIRHVVKLSSIGAEEEDTRAGIIRAHRVIERHIEASGLAFTHLRPHWFFQNELGQALTVAEEGTFHAPDVSSIAAIDARDIAAVAARVLVEDGHEGAAYTLTGPAAIGYGDVAAVLSGVLDRPVRWTEVSLEYARSSMLDGGLAPELAVGFAEIMARYREGGLTAQVSPVTEQLLGRPPRSFAQFAEEHRAAYEVAAAA